MNFALSPEQADTVKTFREFVEREMLPVEPEIDGDLGIPAERLAGLQESARATGYWMPDVARRSRPTELGQTRPVGPRCPGIEESQGASRQV